MGTYSHQFDPQFATADALIIIIGLINVALVVWTLTLLFNKKKKVK